MRKILISMVAMLLMTAMQMKAQSVDYAKYLIEQGKYLEAAKELRPMADGGNAKAQYLAATLFFEGKGINKNDEQGVKYATLSANQGNADAIKLLADYYKSKNQLDKMFSAYSDAVSSYPNLQKELIGARLAECYLHGWGVEKDEEKAWGMARKNKHFQELKTAYPEQWKAYMAAHPEEYGTVEYRNITARYADRNTKVTSVRFEEERVVVNIRWTNNTISDRTLRISSYTWLIANGVQYPIIGSNLPEGIRLAKGEYYDYNIVFERVPRNITSFTIKLISTPWVTVTSFN
jgi:hypothetical protein